MMGLGPMRSGAGGNSSSSTSNLSPLAPPFTVDRLNPKPNLNPNLHYPEPIYSAETYSHGWQYQTPSAPIPELVFESTGVNNVPLTDDYRYLPSSTISPTTPLTYGGEVKPYYSSYVPPLVEEDSLLAEDEGHEATHYSVGPTSGKSLVDYSSSLFDVDYRAAWVDDMGLDSYGKRLDQGGFGDEKSNKKTTQDLDVSYQKFNQTSDKEVHTGSSVSVAQVEYKSCHDQNFAFLPYDSNKMQTSAYLSTYPEPYHSALASDTHKNFSNGQNPFEKSVKTVHTPFIGPIIATTPSPKVVISLPPVTSSKFTQKTISCKPAQSDDNEKGTCSFDFSPSPNSQTKEDPFDRKIKAQFGSFQLPDLDIIGGFNMGCDNNNNNSINVQLFNSTESCSDFVDHHSMSVDSPCWKGASSSQFSPFGIEVGESNKNIRNEYDAIFSSKGEIVNESKKGGFDMGSSVTKSLIGEGIKMSLNDVSEGAVAVHAAEKVLVSPASQEDVSERTVIMPEDRKMNVQTMLKAIHNLSELLLFHILSDDACSLEEENTETLKKTINILDSCLNNKITEAPKITEPVNSMGDDSSNKLWKSHELFTILGSPHTTNDAPDSQVKLDFQDMHERNYSFSGKKDEKSLVFSPLVDDLDITRDDDMTKAIKKVLNDNFQLNEKLPSEALLFKNVWLDAEAKLCSITYKARFDRMKIQIEQFQIKAPRPQDNEDIEETKSEVCLSLGHVRAPELGPKRNDGPIPKPKLQNVSISSTSRPAADSVEDSVMTRFNILKSREDNSKPVNPEMVDGECEGSNIMARLDILRSLDKNSKSIGMEDEKQYTIMTDVYATLDEFHLSVPNDLIIRHPFKNSRMIDQNHLGRRDSSSSDWEHVLKDDFSWKNM